MSQVSIQLSKWKRKRKRGKNSSFQSSHINSKHTLSPRDKTQFRKLKVTIFQIRNNLTLKNNQSSREVGTTRLNKHKLASQGSESVETGASVDVVLVDSASLTTEDSAVTGPMNVEDRIKLLKAAESFEDEDFESE